MPGNPETTAWRIVSCGCCDGLEWGGECPRECRRCGGQGRVFVLPSGVAALYPGGPFLGSGWRNDYANTTPKRVQRRRVKGWRMPAGAVYVGRPTKWGNPFTEANAREAGYLSVRDTPELTREFLTQCFRDWLAYAGTRGGRDWWQGPESDRRKAAIKGAITELRGHDLVCWCRLDQPCHADVLLEIANA